MLYVIRERATDAVQHHSELLAASLGATHDTPAADPCIFRSAFLSSIELITLIILAHQLCYLPPLK